MAINVPRAKAQLFGQAIKRPFLVRIPPQVPPDRACLFAVPDSRSSICRSLKTCGSFGTDTVIIIAIILLSSVLGFGQEKRVTDAVKNLMAIVRIESFVVRNGIRAKYRQRGLAQRVDALRVGQRGPT